MKVSVILKFITYTCAIICLYSCGKHDSTTDKITADCDAEIRQEIMSAGEIEKARLLNNLGKKLQEEGNYVSALEKISASREIYEKEYPSGSKDLASVYTNLAISYENIGNYTEAIKYAKEAEEIDKLYDTAMLTVDYINLGQLFLKKGDSDSAVYYIKTLLKDKSYSKQNYIIIQNNIGNILIKTGRTDSAKLHYMKALSALVEDRFSDNDTYCESTLGIAYCFLSSTDSVQKRDSSLAYANMSFRRASTAEINIRILEASKFLGEYYTITKPASDSSAYYYSKALKLSDDLYKTKIGQFVNLSIQNGKYQKEKEEKDHVQHEITWILYMMAAAAFLGLIFLFGLSYNLERDGNPFKYFFVKTLGITYEFFKDTRQVITAFWKKRRDKWKIMLWGFLIFIAYEIVIKWAELHTVDVHSFLGKFSIQIIVGMLLVRIHHFLLHRIKHDEIFHDNDHISKNDLNH